MDAKVWTVPAARTKAAREHKVPLSDRALAILAAEMEAGKAGEYVFPGHRPNKPLSNMAFEMLLRRIGSPITAHGFRSSFRDWAGNETVFPESLQSMRLRMSSATRPSKPTGGRTRWRDGANLWTLGRGSANVGQERTS